MPRTNRGACLITQSDQTTKLFETLGNEYDDMRDNYAKWLKKLAVAMDTK
jgi:hypothetical protein